MEEKKMYLFLEKETKGRSSPGSGGCRPGSPDKCGRSQGSCPYPRSSPIYRLQATISSSRGMGQAVASVLGAVDDCWEKVKMFLLPGTCFLKPMVKWGKKPLGETPNT